MSWKTASLNWPKSVDSINSAISPALSAGQSQSNASQIRLKRLTALPVAISSTASLSRSAQSLLNQINQLIANTGYLGVAHPWQHTTSQGEHHQRALSAPNALLALATQLKSSNYLISGAVDSVTLLFTANSIQSLHDKLVPFNAAFPIPELNFVARKTKQLLALERNKRVINDKKYPTNFKPRSFNQFNAIHTMANALKQLNANTAAMDLENTAPIAELAQVLEHKKNMLAARESDYQNLKNSLSGSGFYRLFSSGKRLFDIAQSLQSSNYPGHEWTHSVAIIFIAQSGKLDLLKEVFS